MHSEKEITNLPHGAFVLGADDKRLGRRLRVGETLAIQYFPAYRGNSSVSGYSEDRRSDNHTVCGVSIAELEKPGVSRFVRAILRSAVLQCSGDPIYNASAAASRLRIAKLQQQEAHAAAISQTMLNRRKVAAA